MNRIFVGLIFFSFTLHALMALAHLPEDRERFFRKLNTLSLEVVDNKSRYFDEEAGDYPFFAKFLQLNFWRYHPSGKGSYQVPGCEKEDVHQAFFPVITKEMQIAEAISQQPAPRYWYTPIEEMKTNCQDSWLTRSQGPFENAVKMISMALRPDLHPFARHVVFHMPRGVKVKGLLAMKTDERPRPMIILRAGIFSNAMEFFPERAFFIQLFEQSPFNVLLLESSSGTEFVRRNQNLSIGGFDEGLQNLWIAKLLRSSEEPISKYISDLHLAGISLGGHGLFPALWLAEYNRQMNGEPLFQSALAFCPLVKMADTFEYHRAQGFSMELMNYWASRRVPILQDRYPQLKTSTFIQDYFGILNSEYKTPLIWDAQNAEMLKVPEVLVQEFQNPENLFWRLNEFWEIFERIESKQVSTPLLVLTTEKDPIVPLIFNSQRFLETLPGKSLRSDLWNMKILNWQGGYHCSLPVAYDWAALTSLWSSYFLKMSPKFQMSQRQLKVEIPPVVWFQIQNKKIFMDISFTAAKNSRNLVVKIRFDATETPNWLERFQAPVIESEIPINSLDFPFPNEIETSSESRLLERWAYQNISVKREGDTLLYSWRVAGGGSQ